MNKKTLAIIIISLLMPAIVYASWVDWFWDLLAPKTEIELGANVCYPRHGCVGTSTTPVDLQALIGRNDGSYDLLKITAGSNMSIATSGTAITFTSTASGGGGGGAWTTSSQGVLLVYPDNTTDVVLIGGTATTTDASYIFEVIGDSLFDDITANYITANLTGNASTATALAANGANCNAGNAPLGVDASGAVESCFDVWTEAENTAASYISSYSETDPIWNASSSLYLLIASASTTDFEEAHNWGDWSGEGFITATLTEEEVEDFVGGMLGGTETHIAVTYQDDTNDIDFVVSDDWWDALTDMVLTNTYIYVGNASNDPVGVTMSNDCTISNTGAITCDHDALDNFVANEHLDWTTDLGAVNIHAGNYTDTNTTYLGGTNLTLVDTTFNVDDVFFLTAGDVVSGSSTINYLSMDYATVTTAISLPNDSILDAMIDWGNLTDLVAGGSVAWGNIAEGELADSTVVSADIKDGEIVVADTSITAGRSLTWSTNDMVADAETYIYDDCRYIEDPVAVDDLKSIWRVKSAMTITEIWAESDQTVTFNLQEDDGTPANIMNASIAPAAGETSTTTFADASMAAGSEIDIVVDSVSGTPTWISICIFGTYDD